MPTLIITNGDSAAELLASSGLGDAILPWRDVLHEGPISDASLGALTRRRVPFLADRFRLNAADIREDFTARDDALEHNLNYDRIELWFEHDLYDQLQLIQILSYFADIERHDGLSLVQADTYLGKQTPGSIVNLRESRSRLTQTDLTLARSVWGDLAARSPEPVLRRLLTDMSRFRFLSSALNRFVEELPGAEGLSRSEHSVLRLIDAGDLLSARLFSAFLDQEEAAFMGDLSFIAMLDDLSACAVPLIEGLPGEGPDPNRLRAKSGTLRLTDAGRAVLAGDHDHIGLNGIDRWWAGTLLRGRDVWRYDRTRQVLIPPKEHAA